MLALPPTLVFDRDDARRLGWSDPALNRALRAGRIHRLRHGLFTQPGADPDTLDRAAALAASRANRGAVVSHRSALLLHGLPLVGARPPHPEITVVPRGTGSAHAALLHRATLSEADVVLRHGAATTSVARTLVDVARARPVSTAVPAIDAALQGRLVTLDAIDDVLRRCWNWPGIRRAHRALALVDGRAESPLESVSRLVIGWLRLPPPDLQATVRDECGVEVARLDLYWDEFGVAGECDGARKYGEGDAFPREKDRQERCEDLGIQFARWGWRPAWRQPRLVQHKIESAFARGRARDRSGFPREWSISRSKPIM